MSNFHNNIFFNFIRHHKYLLILISILICMSLVLYRSYIFGGKLFLFEDFGSDSVRASLPTYIYLFDWFKNGMPLWSDKMGIGTSVLSHGDIVFDPFTYILFLFGKNNIIYMFVYMVIAKIIFSGIFFWVFLGKHRLSAYAKLIGAITYAFGGYMIVVGQNYVFGTIYAYMPLIFLGFEMWLQNNKKWLLILMLFLTALYFYYFFYMTAIFLGIYAIFRYFTLHSFRLKKFLNYIFSLSWYGLIAMGLSAFYWLPSLALTLNNLRVGPILPPFQNLITLDTSMVITTFTRVLGYDTFGSFSQYVGYGRDYYQLPLYCGLITALFLPQLFSIAEGRKKIAYKFFVLMLSIILFIPLFSYIFNGLSALTYRWIYVIYFSLVLLSAISIDAIYIKKQINLKLLFLTVCVLFIIPFLAINSTSPLKEDTIYEQLRFYKNFPEMREHLFAGLKVFLKDYLLIGLYLVLTILFFKFEKYRTWIKIIILAFLCFELIWFPARFINDRLTTSPDPVRNKLGYFDYTNNAVNYLNLIDKSIYRIDKSYDSVKSEFGAIPSDNEAMVQNYRGLKNYSANNQPNYIRFLQYAGVYVKYPRFTPSKGIRPQDIRDPNLNYINGVGDRYLLQSFLGIKYYLTNSKNVKVPDYYEYVRSVENINIYKNKYFLPLGFAFDNFITHKEFMSLNNDQKDLALLSFIVLNDKQKPLTGISKGDMGVLIKEDVKIADLVETRRREVLQIDSYKEDDIYGRINVSKDKILLLTVPYDQGWSLYLDGKKTDLLKVDSGLIGVSLSPGGHTIRLKYFPQMMKQGIVISFVTFLLILLYLHLRKKIYNEKLKKSLIINKFQNPYAESIKIKFKELKLLIKNQKPELKKYIYYASTAIGAITLILSGLITRGNSFYNLFQSNRADHFMDFFNPLSELFDGPYMHGSIYPPLPLVIYKFLLRLIPYEIASHGAFAIREAQIGQIVFLLYTMITLIAFIALLIEMKKGSKAEKLFIILITLISAPFLFQFERANIIFIALLFSMIFFLFKDSKNRIVREFALISLAVSATIKFYPALFGLLLIKDRQYKDLARVFAYSIGLFFLPFFTLGGIGQLSVLIKNILTTSNGALDWGVGYAVNIQASTRIFFGLLGNFGGMPALVGNILSFIVLILGIISVFFLRSKWKTVTLIVLLVILIPTISFEYSLIFLIIPLIMFLDSEERLRKLDYLYLIGFVFTFIPFTLGKIDFLTNGFGSSSRPLTYGVLIQNISLFSMTMLLLFEGLKGIGEKLLKQLRKYMIKDSNNLRMLKNYYWFIPIFVIMIYNLNFLNRFYPITEGWFSTYAWLFNHGQFPYKDFYFFLTPLYLIKMSIFTNIFGYDILFLRLLGLGIILLMTYFLYKNFEIIFEASIAVFVAIIGMIYYQSGNAHITYDFTQFVTLYGLIQSYFLLKYVNISDFKASSGMKWIFLAGLFAGLTFLTKQSNGAMIVAFSFMGLLLLSLSKGIKELLKVSISYFGGFAVTVLIIILWLLVNSAFAQFIEQIFIDAVSSKGGLSQIFFSWFKGILTYNFVVRFKEILLVILFLGYWAYFLNGKKEKNDSINRIFLIIASLVMLLVVLLPLLIDRSLVSNLSAFGRQGINNIIVAAISVPIMSILVVFFFFILKKPFNKTIFLFSFVVLGFIYGAGTSAGITEAGAFAGFCLSIALMLHFRSLLSLGSVFIVVFCISFSIMSVEAKYERPYFWWNVTSPDVRVKLQSTDKIEMLRGIYTSEDNIKLMEEVSAEIHSGSKPGDSVLLFPNIPVFNLFADRKPPGRAITYWFDFLPDKMAKKEAELIKKNPPKVIVYLDLGPDVWKAHERLFRDGRPSGQRKIVEAFMEVIRSKKMHISKKYKLASNTTLTVWRE